MRVRALLALVLGIAAAVAIGCGDRSTLLSSADAVGLKDELSSVQTALDDGDCVEATQAAASFERAAQKLPTSIDPDLRAQIRQGAANLVSEVPQDCRPAKTTTTDTTTTTETTPTTTTTRTTPTSTTTTPPIPTIPDTLPQTTPSTTPDGTGGTGGTGAGDGTATP